ncbi:hypothetical protein M422DRAFT_262345 [Sphaerobolus stellatus SS14]|uniref:Uncharacterized protein n=1 Tax=Sphaerobolus stellatus (strain SS14) TaxID=990650 RepID=A0A0C9UKM2_SPHS4|nr:hypothetical protein M422DRAFT_262345 [Sphaerobolus stellatus SS14]
MDNGSVNELATEIFQLTVFSYVDTVAMVGASLPTCPINQYFFRLLVDLSILVTITNVLAAIGVHTLLLGRAYAVSGGKYATGAGLGLILAFVSTILVCHFLLNLRKFNTSLQSVPSVNIETIPGPVSGVRGYLQHLNENIIKDFRGSGLDYESDTDDFIEHQGLSVAYSGGIDTELRITPEEFPWAITLAQENVEAVGPSRSREM